VAVALGLAQAGAQFDNPALGALQLVGRLAAHRSEAAADPGAFVLQLGGALPRLGQLG